MAAVQTTGPSSKIGPQVGTEAVATAAISLSGRKDTGIGTFALHVRLSKHFVSLVANGFEKKNLWFAPKFRAFSCIFPGPIMSKVPKTIVLHW